MEIRIIYLWHHTIDMSQWKGERAITLCDLTFYRTLQAKNSMRNTSAIIAVTKSSIKPWRGATTNCHLPNSGERNTEQRRTKVGLGRAMMQALELQRLAKRNASGRSDVEQQRNQACSYSHYQIMLVWRHQLVSSKPKVVSQWRYECSIRVLEATADCSIRVFQFSKVFNAHSPLSILSFLLLISYLLLILHAFVLPNTR